MLTKYIECYKSEEARRKKLFEMYCAKHNILSRIKEDAAAPCNKVVSPFANYITNTNVGYFVGEPVSYKSDDTQLLDAVAQCFKYNDEQSENIELAKDASICGVAYELLYIDTDGNTRFKRLDPITCFPIYDDTIEEEMLYFVRYYVNEDIETGNTTTYVEVYSRYDFKLYEATIGAMKLIEERQHNFNIVPISIYKNNEEEMGDFETVVTLIDAYDNLMSNAIDDSDIFSDAYMVITGAQGSTEEDIAELRKGKVILLDNDSAVSYLTKDESTNNREEIKNTLTDSIHKFSGVPNMADANFAANASGVAMKYKLYALETLTAKKESAFKKGIQRRIELICNIITLMGTDADFRAIDIIFTRNIPSNLSEMADTVNKLTDLLSKETRAAMLPLDIDWDAEKERLTAEAEEGYDDYTELLDTEN